MREPRKRILYLEEDIDSLKDYIDMLRADYHVRAGATWALVQEDSPGPFHLLILDIMIHRESYAEAQRIVPSISFPGVDWKRTGLEFLRKLRTGAYTNFGLPANIPVIVASAVADHPTREEIRSLLKAGSGIYLEKPFTMDELEAAVSSCLEDDEPNEPA